MSRGNSFLSFLAGAVTGAALIFFAKSEKGKEIVNEGKSAVMNGLDKVEDALKRKKAEFTGKPKTRRPNNMDKDSQLGVLAQETKDFLNLAVDEAKLKVTKGLSTALAQVLAWLFIICILAIVLGLLAFALLQWLNILVGAPWGTLIVAGVFILALVILLLCRKKLFRNMFVKLFIDVFYDKDE